MSSWIRGCYEGHEMEGKLPHCSGCPISSLLLTVNPTAEDFVIEADNIQHSYYKYVVVDALQTLCSAASFDATKLEESMVAVSVFQLPIYIDILAQVGQDGPNLEYLESRPSTI